MKPLSSCSAKSFLNEAVTILLRKSAGCDDGLPKKVSFLCSLWRPMWGQVFESHVSYIMTDHAFAFYRWGSALFSTQQLTLDYSILFDKKKYVFWFWKKVGYWLRKDGELKTDFRWFFVRVGYGGFLYKEIYFYEWSCHIVKKLGTWIIIWNDQHIFQYHCVFMSEEERLFPKTTRHVY